jgi:hypothetical protein
MANEERSGKNGRRKSKPVTYFYLTVPTGEGKVETLLHTKLQINRGADTITTWCYPLHKRVTYTYSSVRKRMETAYPMRDACRLLNRRRHTLQNAILEGKIEPPQKTYALTPEKREYQYMWHEKDILAAHEYLSTVHVGRPRKDGLITPKRLPTRRELKAMMRNSEILYVKNENGEFIPTWDAPEF